MTIAQIENIFMYHKPFGTQQARYEALRAEARSLAVLIHDSCPDSRERALALTNLQQTIMWANAAIAINEHPPQPHAPANEPEDENDQRHGLGLKLAKE